MIFSQYPYTDFQELNLDLILTAIKELEEKVADLEERVTALEEANDGE